MDLKEIEEVYRLCGADPDSDIAVNDLDLGMLDSDCYSDFSGYQVVQITSLTELPEIKLK